MCQTKRVSIAAYNSGQVVRAYVAGLIMRIVTNKQTKTDGPSITDSALYFSTHATYFGFA